MSALSRPPRAVAPRCDTGTVESGRQDLTYDGELENYLVGFSNKPPLHVVADFVQQLGANEAGKAIFDAYDQFLTILGDPTKRGHLEQLGAEDAAADRVFTEARDGTAFQNGLTKLFFETNAELTRATQRYGVF